MISATLIMLGYYWPIIALGVIAYLFLYFR